MTRVFFIYFFFRQVSVLLLQYIQHIFNHTTQIGPAFLKPSLTYAIITAEMSQPVVGIHQSRNGFARDVGREPPGLVVRAFLEALQATEPESACVSFTIHTVPSGVDPLD